MLIGTILILVCCELVCMYISDTSHPNIISASGYLISACASTGNGLLVDIVVVNSNQHHVEPSRIVYTYRIYDNVKNASQEPAQKEYFIIFRP